MVVNYPIRWWVFISNIAFTGWYWILVLSISTSFHYLFFFSKTKMHALRRIGVVSLFWTKFCHFLMCSVAEVVHRSSFSFPAFCVRWLKTASLFRKIWPLKKRPLHAAECYIEYTKFISNKGKCNYVQIILSLQCIGKCRKFWLP